MKYALRITVYKDGKATDPVSETAVMDSNGVATLAKLLERLLEEQAIGFWKIEIVKVI